MVREYLVSMSVGPVRPLSRFLLLLLGLAFSSLGSGPLSGCAASEWSTTGPSTPEDGGLVGGGEGEGVGVEGEGEGAVGEGEGEGAEGEGEGAEGEGEGAVECLHLCDCPQGYSCLEGRCQALEVLPPYCCDNAGCPAGAPCRNRRDEPGLCPSGCPDEDDPRVSYVSHSPEECAVVDFDCADRATLFSNECGCGCILDCPDPRDPLVRYISVDPAACAAMLFACDEGEQPFSGACGCGCVGRDTHCDDGSVPICLMIPPVCAEHELLAYQSSCYRCVNPATCAPWGEPGCRTDVDCPPEQYCADCVSGSWPNCEDCISGCRPHLCVSEPEAHCNMIRPVCDPGQTALVRDGCWVCVELATCAPPGVECVREGGGYIGDGETCCPGLEPIERVDVGENGECLYLDCLCFVCARPGDGVCGPGENVCNQPEDCGPHPRGCADEGGHCSFAMATCDEGYVPGEALGCPGGEAAVCCLPASPRDERCDDGRPITCRRMIPECKEIEILAYQDGCYVCVNPATCSPWGVDACARDADCPATEYCDDCASASCPICDDCVAACAPHFCPTEAEVACDMERPQCDQGEVSVIKDGCWVCTSRAACEPVVSKP